MNAVSAVNKKQRLQVELAKARLKHIKHVIFNGIAVEPDMDDMGEVIEFDRQHVKWDKTRHFV